MGIKTVKEQHYIGDELTCEMKIDHIDGEKLDTQIEIDGTFWVCGSKRIEFIDKLAALIDEYRI